MKDNDCKDRAASRQAAGAELDRSRYLRQRAVFVTCRIGLAISRRAKEPFERLETRGQLRAIGVQVRAARLAVQGLGCASSLLEAPAPITEFPEIAACHKSPFCPHFLCLLAVPLRSSAPSPESTSVRHGIADGRFSLVLSKDARRNAGKWDWLRTLASHRVHTSF